MIKEFVDLWFQHKDELQKVISETKLSELSYKKLVVLVIENIINEGNLKLEVDKLTEIDDGDYQGSQLYIVPINAYQPSAEDYYFTENYYGSCSGCDTLQGIIYGEISNGDLPGEDQIKQLMQLCLNLIQAFRKLKN